MTILGTFAVISGPREWPLLSKWFCCGMVRFSGQCWHQGKKGGIHVLIVEVSLAKIHVLFSSWILNSYHSAKITSSIELRLCIQKNTDPKVSKVD